MLSKCVNFASFAWLIASLFTCIGCKEVRYTDPLNGTTFHGEMPPFRTEWLRQMGGNRQTLTVEIKLASSYFKHKALRAFNREYASKYTNIFHFEIQVSAQEQVDSWSPATSRTKTWLGRIFGQTNGNLFVELIDEPGLILLEIVRSPDGEDFWLQPRSVIFDLAMALRLDSRLKAIGGKSAFAFVGPRRIITAIFPSLDFDVVFNNSRLDPSEWLLPPEKLILMYPLAGPFKLASSKRMLPSQLIEFFDSIQGQVQPLCKNIWN